MARLTASLLVLALVTASGCATPQPAPAPPAAPVPAASTPAPPGNPAASPAPASSLPASPLAPFAWLAGCWSGSVNQRDFREMWLPLAGETLVGAGQLAYAGRVQDYQFLRIEARPDGVYFSQFSGDRKELSFRLIETTSEGADTIYTFANTADTFPARLVYRRGKEGWLYETIEGTLDGAPRTVIYPFRRVSCETGKLIFD
jgi:uncharacterized protein DUF6265